MRGQGVAILENTTHEIRSIYVDSTGYIHILLQYILNSKRDLTVDALYDIGNITTRGCQILVPGCHGYKMSGVDSLGLQQRSKKVDTGRRELLFLFAAGSGRSWLQV